VVLGARDLRETLGQSLGQNTAKAMQRLCLLGTLGGGSLGGSDLRLPLTAWVLRWLMVTGSTWQLTGNFATFKRHCKPRRH